MRAFEQTVKRVGTVIWGVNDAENIRSRNSLAGLLDSQCNRSTLKSPKKTIFLFSVASLSITGCKKSKLKYWVVRPGCLYVYPTIVFLFEPERTSKNLDSSSFLLYIFKSSLVL